MGGSVTQLIDEISFIPLESTPISAFGTIDQLEITDNFFIILDEQTNAVLIFDKAGNFHAKINGSKIGYGEQLRMYAFFMDKANGLIQIPFDKILFCYDYDGNLIKKIGAYNDGLLFNFNDKQTAYYSYNVDKRYPDSIAYELTVTTKDGKNPRNYFPYNLKLANLKRQDLLYSLHSNFYPLDDSSGYFLHTYDYTIYRLGPNSLDTAYRFIFPMQASLPEKFISDSSFNYKRIHFLQENKKIIYGLTNTFSTKNNLSFKLLSYDMNESSYIYNFTSQDLICIEKIYPDSNSFFLPITDVNVGGTEFMTKGFLNTFDGYLYTSYSSLTLFRQKDATKMKNPDYPPSLSRYFSNKQNEKGNPVIVQIKFKTGYN